MNPARNTQWEHYLPSGTSRFTVVGIWGRGGGANYRVTRYELKYDHWDELVIISLRKMDALIESKQIKLL